MASTLWVALLVELLVLVIPGSSVAPGDGDLLCEPLGTAPIPAYSANMRVLMDSWNYVSVLPNTINDAEAVWRQVDNDENNRGGLTTNVSHLNIIIAIIIMLTHFIHR